MENIENPKTSKILAVGDLHGNERFAKKLAKRAIEENVDVIILAGDIVLSDEHTGGVLGPLKETKKQILVIPGNHESSATIDFLAEMYEVRNIHGYSFAKGDLGIFGAGGADMGINMVSESDIFYLLKRGYEKIKGLKKKIMVTHMHPEGSKSELSGFPGSEAVKKALKYFQPDVLINSHIHEASGIEEQMGKTKVINVSGKEKIFEI
ncbi:MAG TPA: metallophosphoesterase [Candidatus Omnitrophota bacterium]|nr:metallophosphoesterase [Candidatus Omnitrophota bacterium]